MAKNPLNAEPNHSATASSMPKKRVSTSNETTSTTKNVESNSVEPTSPKTTIYNDRHRANPPNIVILLTPNSNEAAKNSNEGQKKSGVENTPPISTPPKRCLRSAKAKVSIGFFHFYVI